MIFFTSLSVLAPAKTSFNVVSSGYGPAGQSRWKQSKSRAQIMLPKKQFILTYSACVKKYPRLLLTYTLISFSPSPIKRQDHNLENWPNDYSHRPLMTQDLQIGVASLVRVLTLTATSNLSSYPIHKLSLIPVEPR